MTSTEILDYLEHCGAHVRLADGELEIDAPESLLTPALIERLRAHKAELLSLLRSAAVRANVPALSALSVLSPQTICSTCSTPFVIKHAAGWRHTYCPARNHFDQWKPIAPNRTPLLILFAQLDNGLNPDPLPTFAELLAAADEQGQFELIERAAIAEFDGGLTREQAERLAANEYFLRREITAGFNTNTVTAAERLAIAA